MRTKILKLNTLWYLIKKGFENIKNNIMLALSSIITMTICILLFGVFYAACLNANAIALNLQENITITVFMNENISDNRSVEIGELIKQNEFVSTVSYISSEQAWEEYKLDYFDGNEELAVGFEEDNPLSDSNHYVVHISDTSKQGEIAEYIESLEGVRLVNQSKEVADVFTDINEILIFGSAGVIIIFAIVSAFLVQNIINMGIEMRKKEVSIMKTIGATEMFIQLPFIIEGFMIGLIGSIIPLTIFKALYSYTINLIQTRFSTFSGFLDSVPMADIYSTLVPVAFCINIGIGALSSMITLHRKLYKK